MIVACPNIHSKEWKDLVDALGEEQAYKAWIRNNGENIWPRLAAFQMFAEEQPEDAADLLTLYTDDGDKAFAPLVADSFGALISLAGPNLFKDERFLKWADAKGMIDKLDLGKFFKDGKITPDMSSLQPFQPMEVAPINIDQNHQANIRAREIITNFADRLSQQFGVLYEIITPQQAEEMLAEAKTPWKGESAFFIGGRVYFVGEHLTTSRVLHEFMHPVVRAIQVQNSDLFENLYNTLSTTEEGREIISTVEQLYPELISDEKLFREECLVRALEKKVQATSADQVTTPEFNRFINKMLYFVKQLLRRVFGTKVKVENLSENTTLDELADMLQSKDFQIQTELVTDNDVAAFVRDLRPYAEDLQKLGEAGLTDRTNQFYDILRKHIRTVLSNKNYAEMRKILAEESGRGALQEMRESLQAYQTLENQMVELERDIEFTQRHTEALISSFFTLQTMGKRIHKHLTELAAEPDTKDSVNKVFYYDYLIRYWKQFIADSKQQMTGAGISADSEIYKLVSSVDSSLDQSLAITQKVYKAGVSDVLFEQLGFMRENLDQVHKERMEQLRKKNAPQSLIDAEIARYNTVKLDKSKIDLLLEGKMGDANAMNSFLEGYLSNNDPIIASFAMFVKNNITDVLTTAQAKQNNFLREMDPLLKKAGYNPTKIADLGKKITFVDSIATLDDNGNLKKTDVYSFLNPFKGYRYEMGVLRSKLDEARKSQDKKAINDAYNALRQHEKDFFHQEYVPEYYQREQMFESEVGRQAYADRQAVLEKIRIVNQSISDEFEEFEALDDLDELWREYRQLYSLLDINGNKKTGIELEKAQILRQHRDDSRKFFEWVERKGTFENALKNFEQQLFNRGISGEDAKVARDKWIGNNTRVVIKDSFYKERARILNEIKEIGAKLSGGVRNQVDFSEQWADILDAVSGFRDQDGQPIGSDMSEGRVALVKQRQEEIIEAQSQIAGLSGLTIFEMEELSGLFQKAKDRENFTKEDKARMAELLNKKDQLGLSKIEKAKLLSLYEELAMLQHREPTDYYADIMSNWLSKLDAPEQVVDKMDADRVLKPDFIEPLLAQDKGFADWFRKNHIQRRKFNPDTNQYYMAWERLYIWNVIRPNDPAYYETTKLSTGEEIKGLPAFKFFTRVVKPEYRTKKVVGETVDNQGNFLPKTVAQGAKDSRYINDDYFRLQRENPALFNVLKAMTNHHLDFQQGLPSRSRLYLDVPRFRKDNLEYLQSTNVAKEKFNAMTMYMKGIKSYFFKAKDDFEDGLNYDQNFTLVRADMFDDEISGTPIAGLYKLDLDQTSLDVTNSVLRYMLSAERQKKLIEINPVARALQKVLHDPDNAIKDMNRVNRFNFIHRGVTTYINKKGKNVRAAAVDAFIEREFEGQNVAGWTSRYPGLTKFTNFMFKRASFGFFAFNIPSALKNRYGAMFQNMIESAAGKHMNVQDYHRGRLWSFATASDMSASIYVRGPKSLKLQMVEIFDPGQGRFEDKFGESASRTIAKDAASLTWFYTPRKWMEIEATLQMFGGLMYHQKVKQKIGKTEKEIPYAEAWELKNGQIQLKEGIDPEWGINGARFKQFRARVHEVSNQLNGAYARFDQPEAQRYLLYRMASFLRRFFTSMFMSRFAFSGSIWNPGERYNIALGEMTQGYYISVIASLGKIAKTGGKSLAYMTPGERRAYLKFFSEIGMLIAISALLPVLFGWDPDDKDRYEKLRAKSGALNADDFNLGGWLSNHALYLMMQIRAENEQFVPLPGFGIDDLLEFKNVSSVAFGPTLDTYGKMLNDIYHSVTGDDAAYYKRAVGPYSWQQEGSFKLWNHMAGAFGLTGSSVDPVKAIKDFQTIQAMR